MATTVDELQVLITANAASFNKQLQAVQRQMDAMGNNTGKMGNAMSASFAKMAAKIAIVGIAVKKAFDGMVYSVRQFGDMEQNLGGAKAIFGNYADYLVDKSQKAYKAMGMSANQYLATANKIGAIMQGSGISQSQSLAMTTKWMERAADQASVMGVSLETAMEAITGAAKGNFMMMDNIGVKMNATTLEAYALSKGIQASYSEMSEGTKVGLMYQMFMEKTSYAAGNFAKEGATTLNGALATLKASFANLATSLGRGLAPALTGIANFMNNYVIPAFQAAIPYVVGFMQAVGSAVGYVMSALGSIFGFATGGAGEAESAMDGVAEAGAEASKSAGGIASGLGGATKAAKKLKGQLAGFDEMNVLQKPSEPAGGGGGGGGGAMPKFDLPKSAMNGLKKFGDEAEKVANRIKKAFDNVFKNFLKGFNFDKIGKAIKRFGDDIDRFLTPAKKILGDLWNYLQPFIHWVGNDLLPAFLNAVGGALQFIGTVVGAIWDTALKPLIDLFLVPIAQFTGGVIVGVLNAIGDGLRWIANNEAAVGTIAALTTGVLAGVVAYQAYQAIMGLAFGIQLAMNGAIVAGTAANGAYAVGIGIISAAQQAWTAVCSLATGAIGLFSAALQMIPFIAIGAAVAGVVGWLFSMKTSTDDSTRSTEGLRAKMNDAHKQIDKNRDGVISYTEALDAMAEAQLAASNATMARIRAEENLSDTTKKYQPIIDSLKSITSLTATQQKELEKAETAVENASIKLQIAQKKEAEEKKNNADRTREATQSAIENKKWTVAQQLANNLASDSFTDLSSALKDAISKNDSWVDSLKVSHKFTKAEIDELVTKVLASTEEIKNGVRYSMNSMTGEVTKTLTSLSGDAYNGGYNFDTGVARGIDQNSYLVVNAADRLGAQALSSFKNKLGIHSPSKVMAEQGGFFAEGLALGIRNESNLVVQQVERLGELASRGLRKIPKLQLDKFTIPNLDNHISTTISHDFGNIADIEPKPIQIMLKIDSQDIPISAERIANAINDLSFMQNASAINI